MKYIDVNEYNFFIYKTYCPKCENKFWQGGNSQFCDIWRSIVLHEYSEYILQPKASWCWFSTFTKHIRQNLERFLIIIYIYYIWTVVLIFIAVITTFRHLSNPPIIRSTSIQLTYEEFWTEPFFNLFSFNRSCLGITASSSCFWYCFNLQTILKTHRFCYPFSHMKYWQSQYLDLNVSMDSSLFEFISLPLSRR